MKKVSNLSILVLLLSLLFVSCKKDDDNKVKEPKVKEQSVEVLATQATFSWSVDYPGKISSMVEISLNEDMSDSMRFGSEEETDKMDFKATAVGLREGATYYYRYVVWNPMAEYEMEVKSFTTPIGVINGFYSVNESEQVLFSKGNLQYQASTNTWRFADNQYDFIGEANTNISSSYSGWIDLFGWGTSGWDSGANCYEPWSTSTGYIDYYPGDSYTNNLTGNYANADWGVYNAISNGGNTTNTWRTLMRGEWVYVFNTRSTTSGIRYAKACVNNVNGVILLPDDWKTSTYSLNSTNNSEAKFSTNTISATQWAALERNGAVFLPAAGVRGSISTHYVGSYGYYWSASCCNSWGAFNLSFDNSLLHPQNNRGRGGGCSVRLVRSAQ